MKKWEKPELIILARFKPEEAILNGCKAESGDVGPANAVAGCHSAT